MALWLHCVAGHDSDAVNLASHNVLGGLSSAHKQRCYKASQKGRRLALLVYAFKCLGMLWHVGGYAVNCRDGAADEKGYT